MSQHKNGKVANSLIYDIVIIVLPIIAILMIVVSTGYPDLFIPHREVHDIDQMVIDTVIYANTTAKNIYKLAGAILGLWLYLLTRNLLKGRR